MQKRFLSAFLDFQFSGTQINKRMFPIFMGASPVIGKKTRYKHIRAIEYIKFFHILGFLFLQK